jgi:hypothetical protein
VNWKLSLILATVLMSCSGPQRVETVVVNRGCVTEPPPVRPALSRVDCDHELCLDRENAGKLMDWAGAVWRWANDTWTLCQEEK